jgi:hypothetical protein
VSLVGDGAVSVTLLLVLSSAREGRQTQAVRKTETMTFANGNAHHVDGTPRLASDQNHCRSRSAFTGSRVETESKSMQEVCYTFRLAQFVNLYGFFSLDFALFPLGHLLFLSGRLNNLLTSFFWHSCSSSWFSGARNFSFRLPMLSRVGDQDVCCLR